MKCINWFLLFIAFVKASLPEISPVRPHKFISDLTARERDGKWRVVRGGGAACCLWIRYVYLKYNTITNKTKYTNTCIGHIFCSQPISGPLHMCPVQCYHIHIVNISTCVCRATYAFCIWLCSTLFTHSATQYCWWSPTTMPPTDTVFLPPPRQIYWKC